LGWTLGVLLAEVLPPFSVLKIEILRGEPGAEYITPLVFRLFWEQFLLNASTGGYGQKLLGVFGKGPKYTSFVGAF